MPSLGRSTVSQAMTDVLLRARDVVLRRPGPADADEFLGCVESSADHHRNLVEPPRSRRAFDAYIRRVAGVAHDGFLVRSLPSAELIGVVNVNGITRGQLQSATLGYYRVSGAGSRSSMADAVRAVVEYCFETLRIHRLEANIQPANESSRAIAREVGFALEGFSPAYLRIAGEWRDHERWGLVNPGWSDANPGVLPSRP